MQQTALACLATTFLLLLLPAPAVPKTFNDLQGEAFTDPDHVVVMPQEWLEKRIEYEDWGKGADIVFLVNQHVFATIEPLVQKFAQEHNYKIALKEGTCGHSWKGNSTKSVDVAMCCCPAALHERLPGLSYHTIGIEAVGLFVNRDNPVDNITFEQAQKIFQGEISNWVEVKGKKEPINVYIRPHCKNKPGIWHRLLKNVDLFSFQAKELGTIKVNVTQPVEDPNAISFDCIWQLYNYKVYDKVKPLKINGLDPENLKDLASGGYPMYQTYWVTLWDDPRLKNDKAAALVRFLVDEVNQYHIRKGIVAVDDLRKAGWKFKGPEVIGEPGE